MHYLEFLFSNHGVKVSLYVAWFSSNHIYFAFASLCLFSKNILILEQFEVDGKVERRVHRFPIRLLLSHKRSLPHYQYHQYPHKSSAFLSIDEPALTWPNHPKSMVYIMVYSWSFTFYWFGQMYNYMYQ